MTSLLPLPTSSGSALHFSPVFSIAMMALSGTSVSLRYANASARWRKPVRTAKQRNTLLAVYRKWIKQHLQRNYWHTHHHWACACESSVQQKIWAESLVVLPLQLGCLTRLTSQQWLWETVMRKQCPGKRDAAKNMQKAKDGNTVFRSFIKIHRNMNWLCLCMCAPPDRDEAGA